MRPSPARLAFALSTCIALAACTAEESAPQPRLAGVMLDARLTENSGLAASARFRDTLWLVQDGGNEAQLHAISRRGVRQASLHVDGVRNTDWEDLAAFDWQGRPHLLIADTGDNGGLRRTLLLHAVPEPAQLTDGARVRPAWSIAFRWPDGARDCEAIAIDAKAGRILLVSKKRNPPELFSLPLRPASGVVTAMRVGRFAPPAESSAASATPAESRRATRGRQVTAADLSPDGRTLALLTYDRLLFYRRTENEPWAPAIARPPHALSVPWLHQAEAIAWLPDGKGLIATGEFSPAPLVYLPAAP